MMKKVLITRTNEVVDAQFNEFGVYLLCRQETKRNINPNAKRKADEVIIYGIPIKDFKKGLAMNKYKIIEE